MTTPPTDLVVVPAVSGDMRRVSEIYGHYVRTSAATFEIEPPPEAEMERRFEQIQHRGLPWLVAKSAGEVVGYAYAGLYRSRPAYRYTVEDSVYLDSNWTGRGIGGALLRELISSCERVGVRQLIAIIGDSANTASIALHRAAGFAMIGVEANVGIKFGRWLDTVHMQRAIGAGAASLPADAASFGLA